MISYTKYNLVKDLGFVKTGVDDYSCIKKYFSTGSIKKSKFIPEGSYDYKSRPSRANREVFEGDVLQARMHNTNKIILVDKELHGNLFSTGFFQFRPPKELVVPKYLYYLLSSDLFLKRKDELCGGAIQKAINDKNLSKIDIFLPPLKEQQRIVTKLDAAFAEIDRVIEFYEDSVSNAKDFLLQVRASRISELLNSSQKVKLGSLVSLKNGLNYNKSEKGYAIKILGVGDFGNKFSTGSKGLQVIETSSPVSTDYHLEHGDIVFVRSNGNKQLIGRSIVIQNPDEIVTFSGFCIRCRIETKDISPVFLCHYLKSSVVRDKLTSGGIGANISSLNQKMLADIDVPILSEHEQISLIRWIEKLENGFENLFEILVKKVQLMNKLKSTILKQELQPSEAA